MAKAKKKATKKPVKKVAVKAKKAAPKKAAKKSTVKKSSPKAAVAKKSAKATPVPSQSAKLVNLDNFLTPLDDRLVVQVTAGERVTAGGLIIPDTVSDTSGNRQGSVVAVGRGHRDGKGRLHAMDVKRGDKVVFPQYAGNEIDYQMTKLIILRESDVLGILT